jgi:hypothetical protein
VAAFTETALAWGGYPQVRDFAFRAYHLVYHLLIGNQQAMVVKFLESYPRYDPSPEGLQYDPAK